MSDLTEAEKSQLRCRTRPERISFGVYSSSISSSGPLSGGDGRMRMCLRCGLKPASDGSITCISCDEEASFVAGVSDQPSSVAELGLGLLLLSVGVSRLTKHRGPMHGFIIGAALTLVASVAFALSGQAWWLGLVFGMGFLSHSLTDAMTWKGCHALLWSW